MKSILASLVLGKIDAPEGVVPGAFQVTLSIAGAADVVQTTAEATVTFANLAAGDYTVSACRLADSGERISDVVTATITVPAPDQIDVPSSITLSLA